MIVPVYNEGRSVAKLVARLQRLLPSYCDILIVDDGSTDGAAQGVSGSAAVVSLPFNLGIGGAMQTGYRYAAMHGYGMAVQVDGDGQHRPGEARRLLEYLRENSDVDMVVGSRFMGPVRRYHQSIVRRAGAWFLRALIRMLTGLKITDCTSGFRAANRAVIEAFARWYPEDYPEPEVIVLLHRAGFRVQEMAVRMRQRRTGQSSIGLVSGVFYVLKVTTCLLLDLVRQPWPDVRLEQTREAHDPEADHPADDWGEPAAAGGATAPPI